MAFRNKSLTVDYTHPDWAVGPNGEKSVWVFQRFRIKDDDDAIARLVADTVIEYDPQEERLARKQGRRYLPKFNQETKMSASKAMLLHRSRGWSGPEFIVPDDFTLEDGKTPHPLCGQQAPCDAYWIGLMDPDQLGDVEEFLQGLDAPQTEEERQFFREPGSGVDGPTAERESQEEIPVPA